MIFAMNAPTFITLVVVLVLLFFACRHIYRSFKRDGSSCAGCGNSSACGACPSLPPEGAEKDAEKKD